ncbi:ADP-ribosylation factor 2-binding [Pelobates cultripes]|uniref:ADP-ribosylation factor-like protein 2-binding protein n=1 Tax=Pelobates cultripes TaxID=61616 RepID=A0AAD1TJ27_PELCU|nr:ADP-ribosylation factor 2-binding [Pelobates cultripes]
MVISTSPVWSGITPPAHRGGERGPLQASERSRRTKRGGSAASPTRASRQAAIPPVHQSASPQDESRQTHRGLLLRSPCLLIPAEGFSVSIFNHPQPAPSQPLASPQPAPILFPLYRDTKLSGAPIGPQLLRIPESNLNYRRDAQLEPCRNLKEMENLGEEDFSLSISSPKDAEFDSVVGHLEEIIMDDEFQLLQRGFMDKYYNEFEDTEENKLTYTPIFNEYICLVEKFIEEQLLLRIPTFNMNAFTASLQSHQQEIAGDIFDILLTFTDFLAFKEMFLDYKAEKEGRSIDLSSGFVVTPLFTSSLPPS